MTSKMRVWQVKSAIRPNIVCWPGVIFSPVIVDWLFIAMIENLTKTMSHMACFLFGSSQWVVERQHFYQATQNGRWTAIAFAHSKMHILKSSGFWFHNIITYSVHPGKGTCMQPSKLKLLLCHHLATNSFGLGRLFYKSSRQLQNFRRHGDQNGPNLEGWTMQKSNQNRNEKQRIVNRTKWSYSRLQ